MAPGGLLNGPRVRTVQLPILHGCGPTRERGPSRSRISGTRPGPTPLARFPWWGAGWARGPGRLRPLVSPGGGLGGREAWADSAGSVRSHEREMGR